VFHKDWALVSAEEMARCIQCTRCVRFGQEIAGIMELGISAVANTRNRLVRRQDGRLGVVGHSIDVCPVGALTSKPFRYAAARGNSRGASRCPRTIRGSNLIVQVKVTACCACCRSRTRR